MKAVRVALGALGLAAIAFGARGVVTGGVATDRPVTATWLLAGVLGHDLVLLPLLAVAGWLLTRLVPAPVRAPVQAGLLVAGVLVLVTVPLLLDRGDRTNPSSTPLDYPRNLAIVLGVVAAGTAVAVAVRLLRGPRPGEPPARLRRPGPGPAAPEQPVGSESAAE